MNGDLPKNYIPPRDFPSARLLRQREPYHFQRDRHKLGYPRPAQPNTNQPNQLSISQIGQRARSQQEYWVDVFNQYMDRRKR